MNDLDTVIRHVLQVRADEAPADDGLLSRVRARSAARARRRMLQSCVAVGTVLAVGAALAVATVDRRGTTDSITASQPITASATAPSSPATGSASPAKIVLSEEVVLDLRLPAAATWLPAGVLGERPELQFGDGDLHDSLRILRYSTPDERMGIDVFVWKVGATPPSRGPGRPVEVGGRQATFVPAVDQAASLGWQEADGRRVEVFGYAEFSTEEVVTRVARGLTWDAQDVRLPFAPRLKPVGYRVIYAASVAVSLAPADAGPEDWRDPRNVDVRYDMVDDGAGTGERIDLDGRTAWLSVSSGRFTLRLVAAGKNVSVSAPAEPALGRSDFLALARGAVPPGD